MKDTRTPAERKEADELGREAGDYTPIPWKVIIPVIGAAILIPIGICQNWLQNH